MIPIRPPNAAASTAWAIVSAVPPTVSKTASQSSPSVRSAIASPRLGDLRVVHHSIGRADPQRELQRLVAPPDHDDLARAGRPRHLPHRQPDRAGADHADVLRSPAAGRG